MAGFVPISKAKIPLLYSVVRKRNPTSTTFYNIVQLVLNGKYSSNVQTTFYAYNEIIDDDSLFAAVQKRNFVTDNDSAVTLSGPSNLSVLTADIVSQFEKAMDWTLNICFCAVHEELVKHLQLPEMCSRNGILADIDPCHFYYMPIEKALEIDTSRHQGLTAAGEEQEVKVVRLEKEDAQKVTDHWKFSSTGTLERMQDAITTLPGSAGVRVGTNLVSWVVTSHAASINALFTEENHRRKGYGKFTMEAACRFNAEAGTYPNVQIQLGNEASKSLMEELGFVYSHQIKWVIFDPSNAKVEFV